MMYNYLRNPWFDKILTQDLYRGTISGPVRSFAVGVLGAGVYLTWDKRAAEGFAAIYADKYSEEPVVTTYRIRPGLNILDKNSAEWIAVMAEMGLDPWDKIGGQFFSALLTTKLKKLGYDGVISHDPYDGLVIFDSKNVIGYIDPSLCSKCGKRKLMCEKCGHPWCPTTCDNKFEDCPACSVCKTCDNQELDECYECDQPYCSECHDDCPKCFKINPSTYEIYHVSENIVEEFARTRNADILLNYEKTYRPNPDFPDEQRLLRAEPWPERSLWNIYHNGGNGIIPPQYINEIPYNGARKLLIFRGIRKGYPEVIRPGDWVTLTSNYAQQHGTGGEQNNNIIVSKIVLATDVVWAGTDINEWWYAPE